MKLAYICNAFDPETREINNISSDSPAAYNKVLSISKCIQSVNDDISIVSISIFNSNKKNIKLSNQIVDGIHIFYFNLIRNKILKHVCIQFKLAHWILKNRYEGIIFYNFLIDYLLSAIIANLLGCKIVVDIEDGLHKNMPIASHIAGNILLKLYLFLSKGKALVVSSLLQNNKGIKKSLIVYGAGKLDIQRHVKGSKKLSLLFCGTIIPETGGLLLLELIHKIGKLEYLSSNIDIFICGKGNLLNEIQKYATKYNFVKCYGFVSDKEYKQILEKVDVGLVLKHSVMAQTTFPSKIVEFSLNHLAIIAFPSSDISLVFNDNEVMFVNNVQEIIDSIIYLLDNNEELNNRKALIAKKAKEVFDERKIGADILKLIKMIY
jgi:glycosyltransferase involved in cell wall biosynthesis